MRGIGLICCVTIGLSAFAAERPTPVVVLAEDADYKTAKAIETTVEGVLERTPSKGTLGGSSRFNPYRIAAKPTVRELFVDKKAPLLAVLVGQRVRVVGKLVEVDVDGEKRTELWAARIEPMAEAVVEVPPPPPKAAEDGVIARGTWQPAAALTQKGGRYVFRDGAALAQAMRMTGADPAALAAASLAKSLRVPNIDWSKQMVVTVSAGLRGADADKLTVTKVAIEDSQLTIHYRLSVSGPNASGFGYPAETVLIDRFEGPVRYVEDKAPPTPKKAD